jgi:effector-binding domain-containing protein
VRWQRLKRDVGSLRLRVLGHVTSVEMTNLLKDNRNYCGYNNEGTMIETPRIVETEAQAMAFLHLTVPTSEIQKVMIPGLNEVKAAVSAQGVAETGPWFTHHLRIPKDTFDFEICVPVAGQVEANGRVKSGEWPAMKVVRTVYHGDYSGLRDGWGEFQAWIAKHGHKTTEDLWERYLTGLEAGPDPSNWRTELNRPLHGL